MSVSTFNDPKERTRVIQRFCDICKSKDRPIEESPPDSHTLMLRYPVGGRHVVGGDQGRGRGRGSVGVTGLMWDLHPECIIELISRIGSPGREYSVPLRAHDRSPAKPAYPPDGRHVKKHISIPSPVNKPNRPFVPLHKSPSPLPLSLSAGPLKPPINPHPIPDPVPSAGAGYRCADGACGSCDYCRERA